MERSNEINIRGLQHAGIPVTNIKVSEAFYKKLGFQNVMEAPFDLNSEKGTCIMMQRDRMIVELYQVPPSLLAEIGNRSDGHIDHIAFDVADIDETFATVKEAGFKVVEDAPVFLQFWKNGCRYFNITGPDGERLEFNQIL
jgi:lactoylglutathione lyase